MCLLSKNGMMRPTNHGTDRTRIGLLRVQNGKWTRLFNNRIEPFLLLLLLFRFFFFFLFWTRHKIICETANTHTTYHFGQSTLQKSRTFHIFWEKCKMEIIKFSLCSYYFTWALWHRVERFLCVCGLNSILVLLRLKALRFCVVHVCVCMFSSRRLSTYQFTLCSAKFVQSLFFSLFFFLFSLLISSHFQERRRQQYHRRRQRHRSLHENPKHVHNLNKTVLNVLCDNILLVFSSSTHHWIALWKCRWLRVKVQIYTVYTCFLNAIPLSSIDSISPEGVITDL